MEYTIITRDELNETVWIGLVDVAPCGEGSPLSKGAKGAFVYAIARADDCSGYEYAIETALLSMSLQPITFEEVEPFSRLRGREVVAPDLCILALETHETDTPTFGDFHNYFE